MIYKLSRNISIGDVIIVNKEFSTVKSVGLSEGKMIICHTYGVSVRHPFDKVETK